MERRVVVLCVAVWLGLVGCSDSGGGEDDAPTLDRIDGPAEVDPSFDPFATNSSAPPATEGG